MDACQNQGGLDTTTEDDDGLKISDQFAKSTQIGQASKYPQVNKGIF
jgi:hypothetical protein